MKQTEMNAEDTTHSVASSSAFKVDNLVVPQVALGTPRLLDALDLTHAAIVAKGNERLVFEHPGDPCILVKVVNRQQRALSHDAHRIKRWYRRFHREGSYRVYIGELSEYICSVAPAHLQRERSPMAQVLGVAQTSLGLGLLVEKIVDDEGNIAPSLAQVLRQQGWSDLWESRLAAFFTLLADQHIIFNDVGPQNIVYGRNAAGLHGLYLIDGFGSKQAVPIYAWSKQLNRRRLLKHYARLLHRLRSEYSPQVRSRALQSDMDHDELADYSSDHA